jgi:hypothetical protein
MPESKADRAARLARQNFTPAPEAGTEDSAHYN